MRAARLHDGETSLRLEEVPTPEPKNDEVLVEVVGAGLCRSDLHLLDGELDDHVHKPVTMGHEIAGRVAASGGTAEAEIGTPVVVMVGWGCGRCEWCLAGHEQLCREGSEAGATVDGGFAEFVLVPHGRFLVPLRSLDPLEATPLGCAGLSAYAAIQRVLPHLADESSLVILGAGGLGQYAVQIGRVCSDASIVVVDPDRERLDLAISLGAHYARDLDDVSRGDLSMLLGNRGAHAVIDFVGTDDTLRLAAEIVGMRGIVALLGLAGGQVSFGFWNLPPESVLTTVFAGTLSNLQQLVPLAEDNEFTGTITRYRFDQINNAVDDLRRGDVLGRAVVTPGSTD